MGEVVYGAKCPWGENPDTSKSSDFGFKRSRLGFTVFKHIFRTAHPGLRPEGHGRRQDFLCRGAKWGQSRGLGGKEKSILLNIKRVRTKETEVLMIKESTGNESLVYLFINTNLS